MAIKRQRLVLLMVGICLAVSIYPVHLVMGIWSVSILAVSFLSPFLVGLHPSCLASVLPCLFVVSVGIAMTRAFAFF